MQTASIGHNSKLTKQELEHAFRVRTREQRIKENTPFDIRWQWEIWLSELSSSAMLVAFAIRIYADKDGTQSSPSIEALQYLTKQSRNTVLAAIREIGRLDFIRKEIGKGRARNTYQLTIPDRTIGEFANIFDIRSGAVIEPVESRSGSVSEPQAMVQPVNHKPVVVQSGPRSGSTIEPNITSNITRKERGEPQRENSISKVAAAVAAGMTATVPMAAAAHAPAEQVHECPAECWQNSKAQMAAAMNASEARAQKQIWLTGTGMLQVTGEFKAELLETYPLVDLVSGLSAACTNVKPERGAIDAMQHVRRQFGYMQQDAKAKQGRAKSYQGSQFKTPDDRQRDSNRKFLDTIDVPLSKPRPRDEVL